MSPDALVGEFDKALRTLFTPAPTRRALPGEHLPEAELSAAEARHAAALMRVNHSGEICAQALYQGQAIMSHDAAVTEALAKAAFEETEHLNWTAQRIEALGGRQSLLNPFWYGGALLIGLVAGKFGSRWNLGFLAETERQVEAHLTEHTQRLPPADQRSAAVLEQMRVDEACHAQTACTLGAAPLPLPVKMLMRLSAKVMTRTAYWV